VPRKVNCAPRRLTRRARARLPNSRSETKADLKLLQAVRFT
jgi:hypothetical protein